MPRPALRSPRRAIEQSGGRSESHDQPQSLRSASARVSSSRSGSRDTIRIGLLYSNPSSSYLDELLSGLIASASATGVNLIVGKYEEGADQISAAVRLIGDGCDAMILPAPLADSAPLVRFLTQSNIVTLVIGTGRPPAGVMSVGIDDRRAAYEMTRHLLSLGHRRIGFIAGDPRMSVSGLRLTGYEAALTEAGIDLDPTLVRHGLFTFKSGLIAAEELLARERRPSAVFASNDDMAAAVVAVANRYQLQIPRDLTVCGFDDTDLATNMSPELTTVRQPIFDMTRLAIAMVQASLGGELPGKALASDHRLVDFRIVHRGSETSPASDLVLT